ncbi:MAG: heme ABC transporter ATP-binding protein [Myxococcota bacterium]
MVSGSDVSVVRGRPILDGVDLELTEGTLTAVCGPNGAGKSTLLKALSGEITPSRGEVRLGDRRLADWPRRRLAQLRAVLPQASRLSFPFLVEEVVQLGRLPYGRSPRDEALVHTSLEAVGMQGFVGRRYTTLSGGERQRVHLARILAQVEGFDDDGPRVLFLDEPTSSLDLGHADLVLSIARQRVDAGMAVMVVLHDLNLAATWADRMVVLDRGRRVAEGTPDDVLSEDLLQTVFGVRAHLLTHPDTGRPLVVPARGPSHG